MSTKGRAAKVMNWSGGEALACCKAGLAAQELRQTQPMVDLAKAAEAEYKLQAKLIWDDGSYWRRNLKTPTLEQSLEWRNGHIWKYYKIFKSQAVNNILPLWKKCLVKGGIAGIPSGNQLSDIINQTFMGPV